MEKQRLIVGSVMILVTLIFGFMTIASLFMASEIQEDPDLIPKDISENQEDLYMVSSMNFDTAENFDKLLDSITGAIQSLIDGMVDLVLLPVDVMTEIGSGWADSLGSWYAPILVVVVILIVIMMFRGFSMLDALLDKLNI